MTVRPNFLVIGAARSGTTALCRFVAAHPDVFVTNPKEPHFLALAGTTARFTGPGDDEMMNRTAVTDPAAYRKLFSGAAAAAATRRGEGSVSTMYCGARSIGNIDAYCEPGTALVVLLRDPVVRAHSAYLYLRARGHEPCETFEEGLAREDERVAAGWHHMWHYTRLSRYADQLAPFVEHFGRERLLVCRHDELEESPDATLQRVFEFLDLEPVPVDTATEINRSGVPKSRIVHRSMRALRTFEPVRRATKALTSPRLRERVRSANLDHPIVPPGVEDRLRSELRSDVVRTAGLTGLDLSDWL